MRQQHKVVVWVASFACCVASVVAGASESVRFDMDPVPSLLATPDESSVLVSGWPVAPGTRSDVVLTRHDIYAPNAVVYRVEGERRVEVRRCRLHFLWGNAHDESGTPVLVVVDPDTATLHGFSGNPDNATEVRRALDPDGGYLLFSEAELTELASGPRPWVCTDAEGDERVSADSTGTAELLRPDAISTLHRATLAVDTDNELLVQKFSNDTTAATDYIATLFALMSVIYERDLLVRTLEGTTLLRVSTTADPYVQSGTGNADSAKLTEFENWWIANQSGVTRALAMMLSGKQASPNASSGIASVNALCNTSRGYSFSQVFKYSGSTAASDVQVVAHEVGHNFGSRHTHCYLTPTPIDMCYAGEGGCYSGATSCPAPTTINGVTNVRGTLMSYCHLLGGCSASKVFHPRTVAVIAPLVDSKVGVCVFPAGTPQEASPAGDMKAERGSGTTVNVTYSQACGASGHTVYTGALDTLSASGIVWSQRFCSLGSSGSLFFNPGAANAYFVVVGNSGTTEGSYGHTSTGERLAAGAGGACSYTQTLGGTCP